MRRIERRPRARFDLITVYNYIADRGGDVRAERYLRRLNDTIEYLAQQPLMGKPRPEVEEGIRSFACEQHVIFYVPLEDGLDVVRVIHAAMDLESAWRS